MSITALGCEGSHTNGRVGDGAGSQRNPLTAVGLATEAQCARREWWEGGARPQPGRADRKTPLGVGTPKQHVRRKRLVRYIVRRAFPGAS
ncbi:MAG: hypothetical protein QOF31_2970 [Mycobacterium sp.]|jgi:hypothetical protein|nr:hypothetical protein [Mycobacterium sp.]